MAQPPHRYPPKPGKWTLLLALFVLGAWYLWRDVSHAVTRDRADESLTRTLILVFHFVCAAPLLLLPPMQYSRRIRNRRPRLHRLAGKVYLTCSLVASVAAIYLAVQFDEPGRRPPLFLFAVLWFFFACSAWRCALKRQFSAHEHFVSLTYATALGFVLVRVLDDYSAQLLPFISNQEVLGVTREWLCFIIPLITVETVYTWWPKVRPATRPVSATARQG